MFLCGGTNHGDDDYHVVGRNHLLEADVSLYEVLNLDNDCEAERDFVGGPWTRRVIE